jgi:hypothetical protein
MRRIQCRNRYCLSGLLGSRRGGVPEPAGLSARSVAAPLHDAAGRVVAAVSTSTHPTKVPLTTLQRSFLPKLRDNAAAIDAELRTVR